MIIITLTNAAKTNRGIQASWKGVHLIESRHLDLIHKYRKLIQKPKNDYVSTVTFEFGHKIEFPEREKSYRTQNLLGKFEKNLCRHCKPIDNWINNPISRHLCKHTLKKPFDIKPRENFQIYSHLCTDTDFYWTQGTFEKSSFSYIWTLLVLSIWSEFERSEDPEVLSTHCTNMQSCAIEIMIMREQNNSIDIHCSFDIASCKKLSQSYEIFCTCTISFVE